MTDRLGINFQLFSSSAVRAVTILLVFYSMLIVSGLRAEESVNVKKLDLPSCITLTLRKNFTMMESMETLLEKEADYYIARNTLQTKVSGSLKSGSDTSLRGYRDSEVKSELVYKLPEGDSISAVAAIGATNFTSRAGHDLSLQYRYPLAKGNGITVGSKDIIKAQRSLTIQEMNYFVSKQDVVNQVIKSYFRLLQARKTIEVSIKYVESAKENLRITRRKYEEGMVPKIDMTRAEIQYVSSQSDLVTVQKSWADARDDLLIHMGLDPREEIDIDYNVPYVPRDFMEDECVDMALLLRKELLATGEELFQKRDDVTIAKDALKPQVDIVTSYSASRREFLWSGIESPSYPQWSAMLEYSIDISKRSLREELLKTKRLVLLQEQRVEDKKRAIVKEVRSGLRLIRLAASKVVLKEENLKAAEERVRLARRSWEEGLINNRELTDAQQGLVTAQVELIAAKIDYILAEYDLRKAIGYDLAHLTDEEKKEKDTESPEKKSSIDRFLGIGEK